MHIKEITTQELSEYASIPISFQVASELRLSPVNSGLGGIQLVEVQVEPYTKDYDAFEDGSPLTWQQKFDIRNWGMFLVYESDELVGGEAVAWNTNGVNMLEGRRDLAVLWDIRVQPGWRGKGVGTALLRHAVAWAQARACTQLKIETQNNNVAACRFYARMGCELGDIRRFAYLHNPALVGEVQLNWYLALDAKMPPE